MRRTTLLAVALAAAGCGDRVPGEKYFSGEPVARWIDRAKDPDPKTRKKAVEVLGNVGPADPGAIPALTAALKDPDPRVRDAAVLGLSKNGPAAAAALPAVRELIADKDPTVRRHVKAAIDRLTGPPP